MVQYLIVTNICVPTDGYPLSDVGRRSQGGVLVGNDEEESRGGCQGHLGDKARRVPSIDTRRVQ